MQNTNKRGQVCICMLLINDGNMAKHTTNKHKLEDNVCHTPPEDVCQMLMFSATVDWQWMSVYTSEKKCCKLISLKLY